VTATLTGTTADVGDKAGQVRLSEQRAQAVAALLAGLGVPAGRLTVTGRGSDFPGYVVDHDGSGNLLPAAAALNRKVMIELAGGSTSGVCA
jgi:outer membrane protein OmpA-like peptidoglycan-associated protein